MFASSRAGVSAAAPSAAAVACFLAGGVRSFVRPSSRSFSGWVRVCLFPSRALAVSFSGRVSSALAVPFCRVGSFLGGFGGGLWSVSVPCLVRAVPRSRARRSVRFSVFCSRGFGVRRFRVGGFRRSVAPAPVASSGLRPWFVGRSVVGFSGSRFGALASAVSAAVRCVSVGSSVVVGCALGVDGLACSLLSRLGFRASCLLPGAAFSPVPGSVSVFSVASGAWGRGRGAFAARSVACVRSVVGSGSGLWVSFPSSSCPSGLAPSSSSSRCFSGSGSGSWASLAFAVGCGVACLVFLPSGSPPPWGFSAVPGCPGWFGFPGSGQLSLF